MSLSKTFIAGSQRAGKHRDADNLYLDIRKENPTGGYWVFRYTIDGKARSIGLGTRSRDADEVRAEATRFRKWLENGTDPRVALDEEARQAAAELARKVTFREVAEAFLDVRSAGWRNLKHRKQWRATLVAYAYPAIGNTAVSQITTPDVFDLLKPIWATKPESASRVRGRVEAILNFAKVQGHRNGENPAAWRGNLALMLPARNRVRSVKHHAALDWRKAPAFMQRLLEQSGMGAAALAFAILTAARSGEVRLATWDEVEGKVWQIAPWRMKAGRGHRVPLSDAALAILDRVKATRELGPLIFPSTSKRRISPGKPTVVIPLSDMTLTAVLKRMNLSEVTPHGFRSCFRDWAAESTHYPNHVVEQALAHAIGDRVEAAYRRGDLLGQRAALMDDWARYLMPLARSRADAVAAKITPLHGGIDAA